MGSRQKGKHKKRRKSWHRTRAEAYRWLRAVKKLEQKP